MKLLAAVVFVLLSGLAFGQQITNPPLAGPCASISGSATSGYVLTATSTAAAPTCDWETAGITSVDANTLKNAWYLTDGGSANAITGTTTTTYPVAYATGQAVIFKANATNTAATTININSLGAKAVTKGTTALAAGNKVSGNTYMAVYDGTQFQLQNFTLLAADIPTLNQNTTGTSANVTGVVLAANGGTAQSSYTKGDTICPSAATTITKLAVGTDGQALVADAASTCGIKWAKIGSPLFAQTASSSAVTAASETTLIGAGAGSLTIPANWFGAAGTVMDVCGSGLISTAAVPGTVRFKLKFGSTVVADTGAVTPLVSVTNGIYSTCLRLTARTVGASGTIMVAEILAMTGATLTPGEIVFANPTPGTAVVVDTTATQLVDFTITWGTGAINSATGLTFTMIGPGHA